ncbi:Xaa-Pro peptidase family protein [Aliiroseovarius crassostreae]|uniref:Xaa-Pro peptidase family protein n=1 Tax=Aliiroseovarius crassostreae TaxID=154981 RepID=A0A9Q9HBX7_9RHOB|nr:Xaa-Pro peptidase family protein [Aliiroseovarius crassostreae]UWP95036.1 Xaa-Pro peptidase family protein [Aliiroseovarius crassostreae]
MDYSARLTRLRQKMHDTGTDLVAVGPTSHLAWLTGLDPHGDERPVLLLITQDQAEFLMPALNADSVRQHTALPFTTWKDADGPHGALEDILTRLTLPVQPKLALDEMMRSDFSFLLLDKLPGATHAFMQDTIGALRKVKEPAEYDALKASHLVNDIALTRAFDGLQDGISEEDVAAIIAATYAEHGAEVEFINVAFGPNGAFPHHHTGPTTLSREMAVQIDCGCRHMGYPADNTRCGWFGTPTNHYKEIFAIVEQAVKASLAAARPGATSGDVDKAARDVIIAAGYGETLAARVGHGLGLDLHEKPDIVSNSDVVLEEGNVFSIEPGIYLLDQFGIRLEEIVILRATGPEVFSNLPRDMVIRN